MKKLFFIVISLSVLLLAGCQAPQSGRAIQVPGPDPTIQFPNGPSITAAGTPGQPGANFIFWESASNPGGEMMTLMRDPSYGDMLYVNDKISSQNLEAVVHIQTKNLDAQGIYTKNLMAEDVIVSSGGGLSVRGGDLSVQKLAGQKRNSYVCVNSQGTLFASQKHCV